MEELYSARYTFMLLFAEDLLAPSSTHTNKQFFFSTLRFILLGNCLLWQQLYKNISFTPVSQLNLSDQELSDY